MSDTKAAALVEAVIAEGASHGVDALNSAERVIFLIAALDAEVAMEGLIGYYSNSAGNHASEVVKALEHIGATKSAALMRRANALFPNVPPADRAERQNILWSLSEEAGQQIEDTGHALLDRPDNLGEKYEAFIQANRDGLGG